MNVSLEGRRALVTGGAVRVGRAIALGLARAGCDVCIHYNRSRDAAADCLSELRSLGRKADALAADLTDADAARALPEAAAERLGGLDLVINSAAMFLPGRLHETEPADWDRQFALNLKAPYLINQGFAALQPASGCILQVLDARSNRPGVDHFAYRLTKSALETMTRNLALDLAPVIRVNGVALGAILPPPDGDEAGFKNLARTHIPLRRTGDPEVVVDAVFFLAAHEFLTGVILPIDGGQFL